MCCSPYSDGEGKETCSPSVPSEGSTTDHAFAFDTECSQIRLKEDSENVVLTNLIFK